MDKGKDKVGFATDLLAIIPHSDDTRVGHFMSKKVSPINITLGNIPKEVRQHPDARSLVAYLPVVERNQTQLSIEEFRIHKRTVYYTCLQEIFKPLSLDTGLLIRTFLNDSYKM